MRGTWQTTGGSGGPGVGVIVAVIVAGWAIGSGALATVVHAIAVVLIILASTVALAVAGGIAVLILRARQDRPVAPITARVVPQLPPDPAPQLSAPYKPAPQTIEHHYHGPSIHIHGAEGQDAAAQVIRKAINGGQ